MLYYFKSSEHKDLKDIFKVNVLNNLYMNRQELQKN